MSLDLVVLAAGIGSRYGGLKQLDGIGPSGERILDYALYDAVKAGFDRIVFIIRHSIEKDFKECFGHHLGKNVKTEFVYQELDAIPAPFKLPAERVKPWGTAHATWVCRNAVKGPFGIINADDYYGRDSYQLLSKFLKGVKPADGDFAIMGFKLRNTLSEFGSVARGICQVGSDGNLKSVVERLKIEKEGTAAKFQNDDGSWSPLTADEQVSMNMWGLTPVVFDHLDKNLPEFFKTRGNELKSEYLLPTAVNEMVTRGKATVKVLNSPASWFGITYKEDKASVQDKLKKLVAAGVYPSDARF